MNLVNTRAINSRIPGAFEQIPAVLLVGGMGTRLQPVLPSTPKPLAPVGEVPFLELLVLQVRSQGIRHLVLCTGHRAEQIEDAFGDGRKWDVAIHYSRESEPLGTAGALKFAKRLLMPCAEFLVMNGDSFLDFDLRRLQLFHRQHGGLVSMAVRRVPDTSRYGTVLLDTDQRVIGFSEKKNTAAPGIVNGGVYLFKRTVLEHIPDGPASLEKDIFPRLLEYGVYAAEEHGLFIDIGTPEDYARAQTLRESLCQAALHYSQFGPDSFAGKSS
jgi:NDP-sugar pyrophosphorylase family protein